MNAPGALEDEAVLRELLKQYGSHSLAYSTLQPAMRYWGDAAAGYCAYRTTLGQHTFLGDPVCAAENLTALLSETAAAFPNALFMQVHLPAAACLHRLGYAITPVGVENEIETETFSLEGKRMRDLRHWRNRARAGNVVVAEAADSSAVRARLKPISDAWLPQKSWFSQELEFLARPYVTRPEPGTRIFTGTIGDTVVAFVVLDPMYVSGTVTGYTVTILRHYPDVPEGTVDSIILHAIRVLAAEGVPVLSLGVSPFHRLEALGEDYGRGKRAVYWAYLALRRWGNPIYHFRGLSFHKSRYRASEFPVFTAVPGPIGLLPLYASARACRML